MTKRNVFEKIGERIRLDKENKKKRTNRYWKLSANERMHYDSIYDKIMYSGFPFFKITFIFLKIACVFMLLLYMFGIIYQDETFFSLSRISFSVLFKLTPLVFIFDFINSLITENNKIKRLIKLNKRFKIIK